MHKKDFFGGSFKGGSRECSHANGRMRGGYIHIEFAFSRQHRKAHPGSKFRGKAYDLFAANGKKLSVLVPQGDQSAFIFVLKNKTAFAVQSENFRFIGRVRG